MKRKPILTIVLSAVLCIAFGIVAFAEGDHDTPIIPIHTKHSYALISTQQATCTEEGVKTYKCTGCTKSYTEPISPLGHLFRWSENHSDEGIELVCRYCSDTEVKSAQALEEMWSQSFINNVPLRTAKNDSGYLDLDGNRIINAKDYSMILNLGQLK